MPNLYTAGDDSPLGVRVNDYFMHRLVPGAQFRILAVSRNDFNFMVLYSFRLIRIIKNCPTLLRIQYHQFI